MEGGILFPEWIKPEIFSIGPLVLRWYALAYIVGLLLGWRYILTFLNKAPVPAKAGPAAGGKQATFGAAAAAMPERPATTEPSATDRRFWGGKAAPLTPPQLDDFLFWATLGVIIGGRLGYVLFYMLPAAGERAKIAADPLTIFKIWEGGMSFHGGLIGVALAIVFFARRYSVPLLTLGDLVAAAAPIGLFFGRIANFINAELYGRAATVPWAIRFPEHRDASGAIVSYTEPRHPSQLYEALLEGLVLFVILRIATHRFGSLQRPGLTAGLFLAGYGFFRFLVEFVREPDAHMPPGLREYLTMGMLLCLPMIAAGLYLVWLSRTRSGVKA